jgi:hypothetical protein
MVGAAVFLPSFPVITGVTPLMLSPTLFLLCTKMSAIGRNIF